MATPDELARELAHSVETRIVRDLTKHAPPVRARMAHELVEHLAAIAATVRAVRSDAIRALRSEDLTWPAIGDVLDVTAQRAQQLAVPSLAEGVEQ